MNLHVYSALLLGNVNNIVSCEKKKASHSAMCITCVSTYAQVTRGTLTVHAQEVAGNRQPKIMATVIHV